MGTGEQSSGAARDVVHVVVGTSRMYQGVAAGGAYPARGSRESGWSREARGFHDGVRLPLCVGTEAARVHQQRGLHGRLDNFTMTPGGRPRTR